jgi:hypothetical protein
MAKNLESTSYHERNLTAMSFCSLFSLKFKFKFSFLSKSLVSEGHEFEIQISWYERNLSKVPQVPFVANGTLDMFHLLQMEC